MVDRAARDRAVRRVLWIELALNLLVSGVKAAYGVLSGSLVIFTDAIHSLTDAGANIVGLVVMHFASAPPDAEHPYGHRKLEIIAATGIGVAIGYAAVRFTIAAVESLLSGGSGPTTSIIGFVVIGATLVVNVFVALYEARKARELRSAYLAADAAHTASDVLVTLFVLASFAAAHAGLHWADPIGALIVVAVVVHVAWRILSKNVAILLDRAAVDSDSIGKVVRSTPGVRGCHRIRSRGTDDAIQLDLHVLMDGDSSLREAHAIAHRVEDGLREAFPDIVDVTIHMEPEGDTVEEL